MKKHLLNLQRIRAGTYRDISKGLFLDRNERVTPFDKKTIYSLSQRISKIPLNLYPELVPFYNKLSNWLNFPSECIYVTEGVSGAIKSLLETNTNPGENIISPTPTFALYPVYAKMFQLEYRTVGYTDEYNLNLKHLIQLIDDQTSIVFLPNPNMPISGTLNLEKIILLAEHCKKHGAFLAIDEVYYPFGGPTAIDLIMEHKNLFVMRSFSKAFGLAGIRVGYLLGNKEQINYVSKTRTGYETNSVSIEIASFFIDNFHLIEEYILQIKDGLNYLKNRLNKLELEYNGGNEGNFLYVNLRNERLTHDLINRLKERKIYVRGGWPKPYKTGITVSAAPKGIVKIFMKEFSDVYLNLLKK